MRKIVWVGDSTVAFNGADTYPQTGIGQEFDRYIKRDYIVLDFAKNGASSKSFYDFGHFDPAKAELSEGDFLFIQFGHNDEKPKADRHTEPYATYQEYLMRYVNAAREKGAVPVLITPVSRRLFKEDGTIENSHGEYPAALKALAERENIAVVDLTEKSRILYEATGDMDSRKWFMYFPLGTYANYTKKDMTDNTHLHYEGAIKMAGLVAEGLQELGGIYADILAEKTELKAQLLFKTSRSIVIEILDKKADYFTGEYKLTVAGREYSSNKTIFSINDLKPDTDYRIKVQRNDETFAMLVRTEYEFVTLNVRDFGAKGDGETDDTAFLQAAILTAPKNGRVYVPAGVYRFTHLFLKNDLVLDIAKDAVLLAIPDKQKLPILPGRIESYDEKGEYLPASWEGNPLNCYASIITGINCDNVVICGEGTIDGGADFDNWWNTEKRKNDPGARPRMLFLNNCTNVTMQGVTVKNSPSWNLHPYFSKNIKFIDITIQSPSNSHNTDGLDPESCTGVLIAGVHFSVGDDCIAVKSGKIYMGKTYKTPSKDITIRNCFMERGHGGVTIGSEIGAGVENIVVKNCYFLDTDRGLRVKTRRGRGKDSYLNGITFENVKMQGVRTAFVINSFYYCGADGKSEYVATKEALPVDDRTPRVGKIKIKNVECKDTHIAGVYFYGLPESKIECVEMDNVLITFAKDARPGKAAMMNGCDVGSRQGVFIRNAKRVSLKNVVMEGYEGEPANIDEVEEWSWD